MNGIATSFDITAEANEQYNKTIQEKLKDTIYTFYSSWYRVNASGRNCAIFPGKLFRLHDQMRINIIIMNRLCDHVLVDVQERKLDALPNFWLESKRRRSGNAKNSRKYSTLHYFRSGGGLDCAVLGIVDL